MSEAYVVLVEEGQVADDTDPDEQRRGAQEDAADVIACQVLGAGEASTPPSLALPWEWGPGQASAGVGEGARVWKDTLGLGGRAWAGPTLASMPIFMMVPEMVSTSLVTSRMYQPLTNSSRSHRLMTCPRFRRMNLTNSCRGRWAG